MFAVLDSPPVRAHGLTGPLLSHALNILEPQQFAIHDPEGDELAWQRALNFPFARKGVMNTSSACEGLSRRFSEVLGGTLGPSSKASPGFGHFVQARKLSTCYQMLDGREQRAGWNYTHVIRVRPDVHFSRPIDLAPYMETRSSGLRTSDGTTVAATVEQDGERSSAPPAASSDDHVSGADMCVSRTPLLQETEVESQRGAAKDVTAPNLGSGRSKAAQFCYAPCTITAQSLHRLHASTRAGQRYDGRPPAAIVQIVQAPPFAGPSVHILQSYFIQVGHGATTTAPHP